VCIGSGIYNENVVIDKAIRLSGRGFNQSVINGQITNEVPGYYTVFINANNVILEGFLIKGVGTTNFETTVFLTGSLTGNTIIQEKKETIDYICHLGQPRPRSFAVSGILSSFFKKLTWISTPHFIFSNNMVFC